MKKLIVSLLCVLLLGSVVIGCTTDPGTNPAVTTDSQTQSTGETTGVDTSLKDGVPADVKFDGTSIVTSYRSETAEYYVGEAGGNIMSEALYKANLAVEDRLGITREFVPLLDAELTNKIVESLRHRLCFKW